MFLRSKTRKIASKISEIARNLTPKCLATAPERSQNLVKNVSKEVNQNAGTGKLAVIK